MLVNREILVDFSKHFLEHHKVPSKYLSVLKLHGCLRVQNDNFSVAEGLDVWRSPDDAGFEQPVEELDFNFGKLDV